VEKPPPLPNPFEVSYNMAGFVGIVFDEKLCCYCFTTDDIKQLFIDKRHVSC